MLKEAYGADRLGGIVKMVKKVILGTFAVEGAGAVMYAFQFIPEYGVIRGIGYSVFHAVSAFCNAGIDILGNNSLADYVTNPIINVTTILLIILSGLGFTVWFDVIGTSRRVIRGEVPTRWWFTRLRLQSKLALLMTGTLLLAGTLFVLFAENGNPETIGGLNPGQKLMASLFQSVTTRTAGFFTVPQGALHAESKLFCAILMFIGGSPGGTAGGVKTVTMMVLLIYVWSNLRASKGVNIFHRRMDDDVIRKASNVVMISVLMAVSAVIFICYLQPSLPVEDVMFEVFSAIGTVGMSTGLTRELGMGSRIVIILLMYCGRIGSMSFALSFTERKKVAPVQLPVEKIMIG